MKGRIHIVFILLFVLSSITQGFAQEVVDSVRIYFRQGYSILEPSIRDNQKALNRIADSLNAGYRDSIYVLKKVHVVGGASPEGTIPLNKRLSEKRAGVLFKYLSRYRELPAKATLKVESGKAYLKFHEPQRAITPGQSVVFYLDEVVLGGGKIL